MSDCRWATAEKCKESVYVRDCYRRTGRGPSGFQMHYTEKQCGRRPKYAGYCWQHRKAQEQTQEGKEKV